jgi:hypothetical protein
MSDVLEDHMSNVLEDHMSDVLEFCEPTEEERERGPLVKGLTFWGALGQAAVVGETEPLAAFIASSKARATINEKGWRAFAYYLASIGKTQGPGNPVLQTQAVDPLVYAAARRVYLGKAEWREREGKPRVRKEVINELIKDAIRWIAEQRGVVIRESSGEHASLDLRIRNLLINLRFLAHSNSS